MSVPFDMGFDSLALDTHLNRLFNNNMFEPFIDQQPHSCSPQLGDPNDFSWMDGSELYPGYGDDSYTFQTQGYEDQGFSTDYAALTSNDTSASTSPRMSIDHSSGMDSVPSSFYDTSSVTAVETQDPGAAELDHYRE